MATLLALPAELIASIAACLTPSDLMSFRIVSSIVERACFDMFARKFFRKKGFMISTDALSVLRKIAEHPGLSRHVQHVWFNPDCFLNRDDQTSLPDFLNLILTPTLRDTLERNWQKFLHLKTVGMRRGPAWPAYGWSMIAAAAGEDPRYPQSSIGYNAHYALSNPTLLFAAIVASLARSRKQIARLYTDAIELSGLDDARLSSGEITTVFKTIQYLEINLIKAPYAPHQDVGLLQNMSNDSMSSTVQLFQACSDLRELAMTIYQDLRQRHVVPPVARDPQSWRTTYPFQVIDLLSKSVRLTQLRRVKLEKISTTASALVAFLRPSSEVLMSLKLRHIHLLSMPQADGSSEDTHPWQQVFQFLSEECGEMIYLLLHLLRLDGSTVRFQEDVSPVGQHGERLTQAIIPAVGPPPRFNAYDNLTIEAVTRASVKEQLVELVSSHWSGIQCYTYDMDESIWHTDTSDEEW